MMLSIFKGNADTMPVAVSLDEVVRLIREDKVLADHTEKYRYYRSQGQNGCRPGKGGLPLLCRGGPFCEWETENRYQWLDRSLDGGL